MRHGMYQTRVYRIWRLMKQRCQNPNSENYYLYGGRGIKVCDRWQKFENFYEDMGDDNGLSLDRKDSNGDYSPKNCRWATLVEQNNNSSRNIMLTFKGKTQTIAEWCREDGVSGYSTVTTRLSRGWSEPQEILYGRAANAT